MHRLILHIGVPKTGTTTLQQDVFTKLESIFLGVIQPRNLKQHSLFEKVVEASKKQLSVSESRLIKDCINELLKQQDVLISEEMFLLDEKNATWQEKLGNLSKIFSQNSVEILITIREPIAAVRSFFLEIYSDKKYQNIRLFDFITTKNESKIFQYQELIKEVKMHFQNCPIFVFPFEQIIRDGDYPILLNGLNLKAREPISLEKRNKRNYSINKYGAVKEKNKLARKLSKLGIKKFRLCEIVIEKLIEVNTKIVHLDLTLTDDEEEIVSDLLQSANYTEKLFAKGIGVE